MGLIFNAFLLLVGFVLLIKGADVFVDGSSDTARKFKVPKMLIGLTIVSFGTSAPELAVSIQSILAGKGDILLGNVIGSNILNILLILGVSAMVGALHVKTATVRKEIPVLVLMTLGFAAVLSDKLFGLSENLFTRQDGVILLLFFGIFIYYLFGMLNRKSNKVEEEDEGEPVNLAKSIAMIVFGLLAVVLGSDLVVRGASDIAANFGVSQRLISLTIVALGTSLPELVTSVIATKKGEYDIAIGNIVGSNIFNIGIVAGLPVAILGGVAGSAFSIVDVVALVISPIVLFIFAKNDQRISFKEGLAFLVLFVIYYGYVIVSSFA